MEHTLVCDDCHARPPSTDLHDSISNHMNAAPAFKVPRLVCNKSLSRDGNANVTMQRYIMRLWLISSDVCM
jgi:hypothetical protein